MERDVFSSVKSLLRKLGAYRRRPKQTHSDGAIVAVFFFAALRDRAVDWACDRANWPKGLWRGELPSQSCMSRRLREPRIVALQQKIERAVRPPFPPMALAAAIDGMPLEVALHSTDPHAGKGRGVGHIAKGYKVHAVISSCGTLLSWRLASLNVSERTMAARLFRDLPVSICYMVADAE